MPDAAYDIYLSPFDDDDYATSTPGRRVYAIHAAFADARYRHFFDTMMTP